MNLEHRASLNPTWQRSHPSRASLQYAMLPRTHCTARCWRPRPVQHRLSNQAANRPITGKSDKSATRCKTKNPGFRPTHPNRWRLRPFRPAPGLATASRAACELYGICCERLVATWRAKIIGLALILSPGRCPFLVNHHAAYWIRWHNTLRFTRCTPEIAATHLHRPADCHRPRPLRLQSWQLLRREVLTDSWSPVTRHSR